MTTRDGLGLAVATLAIFAGAIGQAVAGPRISITPSTTIRLTGSTPNGTVARPWHEPRVGVRVDLFVNGSYWGSQSTNPSGDALFSDMYLRARNYWYSLEFRSAGLPNARFDVMMNSAGQKFVRINGVVTPL